MDPRKLKTKYLLVGYWGLTALVAAQQYGFKLATQGDFEVFQLVLFASTFEFQTGESVVLGSQVLLSFFATFIGFCCPLVDDPTKTAKDSNRAVFSLHHILHFAWIAAACIRIPTFELVIIGLSMFIMLHAFRWMVVLEDDHRKAVRRPQHCSSFIMFLLLCSCGCCGYLCYKDHEKLIWTTHFLYNVIIGLLLVQISVLRLKGEEGIADDPLVQLRRAAERRAGARQICEV